MKPAITVGARARCICLYVFVHAVRIPFQLRTDCDDVQAYNRARYAGEVFRTFASSKKVKRSDAYLRYDYVDAASRMAKKGFAKFGAYSSMRLTPVDQLEWWRMGAG